MSSIGRTLVGVVASVTLLWPGAPARAGGGSWAFPGHNTNTDAVLVVGEVAHARALLNLQDLQSMKNQGTYWAGPEQGPFFGYMTPRDESGREPIDQMPPPLPKGALTVGEVVFAETDDPRMLKVRLDFTVPDVEPGPYTLHHCNDPCTRQIGDTMSTPVIVVSNTGDAFALNALARLDRKMDEHSGNSWRRTARLERWVERLTDRIRTLEVQVEELQIRPARAEEETRAGSLAWPAAAGIAVSAALILLARRNSSA